MELTHEELEEYLLKIFTGRQLIYIYDVNLVFKQPNNIIKMEANAIDGVNCSIFSVKAGPKVFDFQNLSRASCPGH